MVNLTVLEIHLEGSDLSANVPYGRGEKDVVASDEPPEEESGGRKRTLLALSVGLVFSVLLAYVVRKRLAGENSGPLSDDGD